MHVDVTRCKWDKHKIDLTPMAMMHDNAGTGIASCNATMGYLCAPLLNCLCSRDRGWRCRQCAPHQSSVFTQSLWVLPGMRWISSHLPATCRGHAKLGACTVVMIHLICTVRHELA